MLVINSYLFNQNAVSPLHFKKEVKYAKQAKNFCIKTVNFDALYQLLDKVNTSKENKVHLYSI